MHTIKNLPVKLRVVRFAGTAITVSFRLGFCLCLWKGSIWSLARDAMEVKYTSCNSPSPAKQAQTYLEVRNPPSGLRTDLCSIAPHDGSFSLISLRLISLWFDYPKKPLSYVREERLESILTVAKLGSSTRTEISIS